LTDVPGKDGAVGRMVATHPGEPAGWLGLAAVTVAWAAVLARALGLTSGNGLRLAYALGMSVFLVLLLVVIVRRPRATPALHIVFAAQVAIVLVLLGLDPQRDFVTSLLVLECYEAAVVFAGTTRLAWVILLVVTIGCSLVLEVGPVHGLALALIPMAAGIVLAMFAVAARELEAARATSARMVADLEAARQQLQDYAGQVDELAAIEERSWLARELEESVSGELTAALAAGAEARERLDDPPAAAAQLERLQALAQEALAQMRRIITELRPQTGAPAASGGDAEN
jgi:signal transduction histidine kinase